MAAICQYAEPLIMVGYKTQEDIQALEGKVSALQKEKKEVEQSNDQLLTYSSELRTRAKHAEWDLTEANGKLSALEVTKLKAENDKLDAKKEIENLKAEIAHLEDSWAKSFDENVKNIMQQVKVICKDYDF